MLEFTWPSFVFAVINFLVLVGLLWKFLHRPLLDILEKREQRIKSVREEAESELAQARKLRGEYENRLAAAEEEKEQLLAEARRQAEEAGATLVEKARAEAGREAERHKRALERERREALDALRREVAATALDVAGSILAATADADVESKLQAGLAAELERLAAEGGAAAAGDGKGEIRVASARELDDKVRKQIAASAGRLGGGGAEVAFETDPSLLAGARAELGTRIVDTSLRGLLEGLQPAADAAGEAPSDGEAAGEDSPREESDK